jgi:hypothetical protein
MNNANPIRLIPICHLPVRSTWQATISSLARIKGPRALSALTALMLAGVLSFLTCLRAGNTATTIRSAHGAVLLLTYSES